MMCRSVVRNAISIPALPNAKWRRQSDPARYPRCGLTARRESTSPVFDNPKQTVCQVIRAAGASVAQALPR